jgi:hypothetical protein
VRNRDHPERDGDAGRLAVPDPLPPDSDRSRSGALPAVVSFWSGRLLADGLTAGVSTVSSEDGRTAPTCTVDSTSPACAGRLTGSPEGSAGRCDPAGAREAVSDDGRNSSPGSGTGSVRGRIDAGFSATAG